MKKLRFVFPVLFLLVFLSGCGRNETKPNIVLIIIDTLRADHLGCYGYDRNTSPTIDSLAASGTLWEEVQAQSSWTLPAITSIFTGLDVRQHGAGRKNDQVYGMNPNTPFLPLLLNHSGYATCGIFNVYLLSEQFGFNKGFDSFSCNWMGSTEAENSVNQAIDWIQNFNQNEPFFLALHVFDVHDPYDPPPPFDLLFSQNGSEGITDWPRLESGSLDNPEFYKDHIINMYDGEIAWTDFQISRLLQFLRNSGLDENTVIIITSDHGEEFLEHNGFGHGKTMYQEVVHVPLIISGPGFEKGLVDSSVRAHIDILPTILDMIGAENPADLSGYSLLDHEIPHRTIPSSNVNSSYAPPVAAIRFGESKLIWNSASDESREFNLSTDPLELNPLSAQESLLDSVLYYWSTPPVLPPVTSNRDIIDAALRDLGYF